MLCNPAAPAEHSDHEGGNEEIPDLGLSHSSGGRTGCWSLAYETDFDDVEPFDRSLPAWKLGHSLVNMISGPLEFCAHA